MLSFILDYKMIFMMTNVSLSPMLMIAFVMIYGNNIASVKETAFY